MRKLLVLLLLPACVNDVLQEDPSGGPLATAFQEASERTGVPEDLLKAVGYVETRYRTPDVDNDHVHHGRGERGLMGIVDRDDQPWLRDAARALQIDVDLARQDPVSNVHVAARVLRDLQVQARGEPLPTSSHGWRDALSLYGADGDPELGDRYADQVFLVMETGARATAENGEVVVVRGTGEKAGGATFKAGQALSADSSLVAEFTPAREGFFSYGRSQAIDRVVIHTTEGSYNGAISWFRSANNPYRTSAHYVIRSSDGEITQMVAEENTAHHVRSWNSRAIGIEHEAISSQASWFTDEMYRASAALVRDVCARHGIPMDRAHIVGHNEVPGNDHSDPGQHWDWAYFMELVLDGDVVQQPAASVSSGSGFCETHGGTWCDGDDVVFCQGGAEITRTACTSGCTSMPQGVPDECADDEPPPQPADPCGGETFEGRCDGETLIWCQDGDVRTYDCADSDRTCGWQDDTIGHNCLAADVVEEEAPPPPPADDDGCDGETYQGRCVDDVLIWCDADTVFRVDCASDGQQCGWQDETIGNNCL
jgi:hypothetical protein